MPNRNSVIIGSIWKFSTVYIDNRNIGIFDFLMDTGLGEMNSLGYGFLNKLKYNNDRNVKIIC